MCVALLLDAAFRLYGLAHADGNEQTIQGARRMVVILPIVLAAFALRGHRWPKWALIVLLVTGLVASLVWLVIDDQRGDDLVTLIGGAVALVILLRGWRSVVAAGPARPARV